MGPQGLITAQEGSPVVLVNQDRNGLSLRGDLLEIIDRATVDFIPMATDEHTRVRATNEFVRRNLWTTALFWSWCPPTSDVNELWTPGHEYRVQVCFSHYWQLTESYDFTLTIRPKSVLSCRGCPAASCCWTAGVKHQTCLGLALEFVQHWLWAFVWPLSRLTNLWAKRHHLRHQLLSDSWGVNIVSNQVGPTRITGSFPQCGGFQLRHTYVNSTVFSFLSPWIHCHRSGHR